MLKEAFKWAGSKEKHSPTEITVLIIILIIAPGPGSYRAPSDFGHYERTTK